MHHANWGAHCVVELQGTVQREADRALVKQRGGPRVHNDHFAAPAHPHPRVIRTAVCQVEGDG
jgi:hypothetical protein